MKKRNTIICGIIIVVFMISVLFGLKGLINLAVLDYNSEEPSNPILNITSIVTCFIASMSLLVSFIFGMRNSNYRIKEKQQDIEYYWYKALVVDKLLPLTFSFFGDCKDKYVDELMKINDRNEKNNLKHDEYIKFLKSDFIEPFTSQYTTVQEQIIIESAIINDDLSLRLKEDFEKFQDDFLSYSEQSHPDYKKMKTDVVEAQKRIISLIKQFNEKIYSPK